MLLETGWANTKRQLLDGAWIARGRCGSALAPSTTIPASAWPVLRLYSPEKSIVSEGKGNRIYDVRIYPTANSDRMFHVNSIEHVGMRSNAEIHQEAPSSKRVSATSAARNECTNWLTQEMKKSPMKRVRSKNEWREDARKQWPRTLSVRQFNLAWEDAKKRAGAEQWGSAGRQRK
jgi:hypothetical protein